MNWDNPAKSKWFAAAALAVMAVGIAVLGRNPMPQLSAPAKSSAAREDAVEMRDAVASPGLMTGRMSWFQSASGAAWINRTRQLPQAAAVLKSYPAARPSSGRTVYKGAGRVIVDQVKPGAPEPGLSNQADEKSAALRQRLRQISQTFLAKAQDLRQK